MAVRGNSKWKLKLIKLHKKYPMIDTFVTFIFGLTAYPINEFICLRVLGIEKYSNLDLCICIFGFCFDIFILVYFFKFSREALNISIGNKKYTMKDFDDEFLRCMTEDLANKSTDEKMELYTRMHSLQTGTAISSLKTNKKTEKGGWSPSSSYDKFDKGDN